MPNDEDQERYLNFSRFFTKNAEGAPRSLVAHLLINGPFTLAKRAQLHICTELRCFSHAFWPHRDMGPENTVRGVWKQ